ncbi:MAG: primosomal protein N' [Desulfobacterales bacterium RIFOXYA12_FULL_46_15]|nr:MAG: primosomal protein N' [Desulfobacterales bacterium RIFOXYA12_FULL_46_15]
MIDTPYISVAVALPVQKAYAYGLPEQFRSACSPGVRVLVPFGRKRVTGYILSGRKSCGGFTIKNILDVLDDHPLFPESEIPFFQWISDYYLHPLGEVIKSALPSGLESHDESCLFVTEKGRAAFIDKMLTPGEEEIIEFVQKRDPAKLKQLFKTSRNPSVHALVRRMEKQDLVTVSYVLKKDGATTRTEKFILFQKEPEPTLPMSKKREKLLMLVKQKKEMSLTSLKAVIPTAPSLVKPLSDAGFIKIIQRQVFRDPLGDPVEPDTPPVLTPEQTAVVKQVQNVSDNGFSAFLLTGITGSGKTEVYMRLVLDVIEKGKKAIVLVPEIALISQTERRFRARFGERIAVIHSSLSKGELLDQWRKIALNKVDIVIGARSAVFAPFENIGIIVADEEHDTSYKQETGLRYNARDLAVVRGKLNQCPVLLGSATPSLQSYQNVVLKRFEELKLESRINRNPLPEITLVDLKKYKDGRPDQRIITPELSKAIRQCLDKGDQALIFLNRRGFATFPVCRDCGKALTCRFCDITMTLHKGHNEYRCHLCGYGRPVDTACPECKSKKIRPLGFGTEKVESMLKERFPDARIARMDQDSTSKKGAVIKILKTIRNRTVDIVVGTQMLAKGHDFPSITLVGVICADLSLSLPDFRAGERTFQLLAQVAGRAGRGETPGKVIMQTYNPDHFIIEASRKQDFLEFFQNEAPFRKALMYPPFSRMTQLKIFGSNAGKVKEYAETVAKILRDLLENEGTFRGGVQILGPAEAPIQKISSQFRWQILVKSPSSSLVNRLVKSTLAHPEVKPKSDVGLSVDVDPYFLM